ncbi:nuclear transport factor 2 family protein [Trujillonella endophytica]|uniref:SnoaL-like domain-containing protein n=1 Tax=Trujillonella endophytica TaxID=673521 RepID=A0A1H8SVV6_9ACTN|nr:nuclear transport factor 2 family protein [Trujillella endophytica]SEO82675.1 SnoaL-like domain-containing protein [Trujillella endophytica]
MSGSVEAATVLAVLQLHAEYGSRMDGGDPEGLARLFTEDGVFSFEETDTIGWAALADFARASPVGIHVSGAPTVEAGPDATVLTRCNFVFVSPENRRITTGWYVDTLVPGGDGLLFARRRAELRGRMDL